MRKKLSLLLLLLLIPTLAYAWGVMIIGGGVPTATPYCSGSELFCTTFEAGDDITWDTETDPEDCDGYDADGDWCDDETTIYKNGSEGFGIRGQSADYVEEALSTIDQTEFHVEFWWRVTNVWSNYGLSIPGVLRFRTDTAGKIYLEMKGTTNDLDTGYTISNDTWYHIGVHVKLEVAGGDDGIVRMWVNTTGDDFVFGDLEFSDIAVDTGTNNADNLQLRGPASATGVIGYFDDVKVKTGAPSWPTS